MLRSTCSSQATTFHYTTIVATFQMSVMGGSAWTYDDTRGQYYFHQFLPSQPDLNLRNPAVKTELEVCKS